MRATAPTPSAPATSRPPPGAWRAGSCAACCAVVPGIRRPIRWPPTGPSHEGATHPRWIARVLEAGETRTTLAAVGGAGPGSGTGPGLRCRIPLEHLRAACGRARCGPRRAVPGGACRLEGTGVRAVGITALCPAFRIVQWTAKSCVRAVALPGRVRLWRFCLLCRGGHHVVVAVAPGDASPRYRLTSRWIHIPPSGSCLAGQDSQLTWRLPLARSGEPGRYALPAGRARTAPADALDAFGSCKARTACVRLGGAPRPSPVSRTAVRHSSAV